MNSARRRYLLAAGALPLASSAATAQPGDSIDWRPLRLLGGSRWPLRHGYAFPVTLDAAPLRSHLTARRIVPMTFVIDARGRLMRSIPGEMAEADVLELAGLALASKG